MMKNVLGEPKTDRRIQRTRRLLHEAMVALILEKGYDAITVQDILDKANMGRSTFYAHFRDKEDLLLSGFQMLFSSFESEFRLQANGLQHPAGGIPHMGGDMLQTGKELSLFFFRHAGSHQALFRAMIGEQGGKIILEHTQKYLAQSVGERIGAYAASHQKNIPVEVLAHYIASSYLALLTWWLDHDLPYSAEQMDALFWRLVIPGIQEMVTGAGPAI